MKAESFIIDFTDAQVAKIYSDRWVNTATLMGIMYQHVAVPFGEGKYHYRAAFDGHEDDVKRFMSFINESISLLDKSEIVHEN